MSNFFDALETRTADERNSALATRLPQQIAHAKTTTGYFAATLKSVDATKITSTAALAALPVMAEFKTHLGGLNVAVFDGVFGNPTCAQVMAGAAAFKAHGAAEKATTSPTGKS